MEVVSVVRFPLGTTIDLQRPQGQNGFASEAPQLPGHFRRLGHPSSLVIRLCAVFTLLDDGCNARRAASLRCRGCTDPHVSQRFQEPCYGRRTAGRSRQAGVVRDHVVHRRVQIVGHGVLPLPGRMLDRAAASREELPLHVGAVRLHASCEGAGGTVTDSRQERTSSAVCLSARWGTRAGRCTDASSSR